MADARLQVVIEAVDKYSDELKKVQQTTQTWVEFLKGRMGPAMKEFGGHAAAMKALSAEYKIYKEGLTATGQAQEKVTQQTQSFSGSLENALPSVRKVGIALSAFGAVGILAIRSMSNAALEQQRAMSSLAAVVENSGVAFDSVRGKVEAVTAALARKTAVGDEEQMRALGLMVPILGDVDKALAALPAVLDLSATSGRDLAMTARTLSAALAGNMDSSSQLGLKFEETAGFGERLQQVLGKVQGAAAANADPFAKLSDSMGELKEKMGVAVLPLVKPFVEGLSGMAVKLTELDPRLFKVAAGLGVTATALASLAGPALMAVSYLPKLVAGFQMLAAIQWGVIANGIASVGASAAAIAAPVVAAAVGAVAFGAAFRTLAATLTLEGPHTWGAIWETFTEDVKGQMKSLLDSVTGLLPAFDAEAKNLKDVSTAAKGTASALGRITFALGETRDAMDRLAETEAKAVQRRLDLLRVSELLGTSFDDLQEAIGEHVKGGLVPAVAWEVELALQSGRVNLALEALAATVVEGAALLAAMREQGLSLVEMFNRLSAASKVMFKVGAVTDFDQVRAQLEAMGRSIGPALEQYEALLDAGWESAQAWAMVSATIKNSVNKELDEFAEKLVGGKEKLDAMRVAGASWAQMFTELGKLTLDDFADDLVKTKDSVDDFADRGQVAFDKLKLALETMGRSVEPLEALLQSLTDVGLDLGLALEVAATVAGEQLNAELDKLVAGAQNGEVWLRALRAAGADLATMFRVISSLPLAEKIRDVKKEAEEATLAIEHMMAKLDQAVRAQQRTPREKLEAQIADVEKALATTTDLWRRNELEVMLRNMRDQLEQMKVAYAAAQGLFIMGQVAAGTGPQVEAARKLIESLSPLSFQRGGVVTRPTVALLGERGPEAVIPFPALDRLADRIAASIGGAPQPVVVTLDGRTIATVLGRRAERQEQVRS